MMKSRIIFSKALFTSTVFAEAYLEHFQTYKMETFAKIVNRLKPLIVCAKNFILDIWQDWEYGSLLVAQILLLP